MPTCRSILASTKLHVAYIRQVVRHKVIAESIGNPDTMTTFCSTLFLDGC